MTEIYVARRNGILREPDGTLHRLVAGKTLAAGTHPAVTNSPDSWRPMVIELDVDGEQGPQDTEADPALFLERMELAEAERDKLVETLSRVVAVFDQRGLLVDYDRDTEGWLVLAVSKVLEELDEPLVDPEPTDAGPVVAAPELADPTTPEGRAAIREWAWANDVEVSEHGTLPKAVVEQYRAAHA
jgi:hypothetical protein